MVNLIQRKYGTHSNVKLVSSEQDLVYVNFRQCTNQNKQYSSNNNDGLETCTHKSQDFIAIKNLNITIVHLKQRPNILPSIGAAVNRPLSLDDIRKSQVADGKTNDIIVMPMAVFM